MKSYLLFELRKETEPHSVLLDALEATPAGLIKRVEGHTKPHLQVIHIFAYRHTLGTGRQVPAVWYKTEQGREFVAVQCALETYVQEMQRSVLEALTE